METRVTNRNDCSPARRQHGVSLVEIMVSITIGLILLAGMTTLFVNQNQTQVKLDRGGRMIDNGRYALQLLSDDLQLAGYFGEHAPTAPVAGTAVPDPCSVTQLATDIRVHIQGVNGIDATGTNRPACFQTDGIVVKEGTDVLVVRRASTTTQDMEGLSAGNTTYFVQASTCETTSNAVTVNSGGPGNFTQRTMDCLTSPPGAVARGRQLLVRMYYISPDNVAGDDIPTLKRYELTTAGDFDPVPLVEGIEDLQIYYGHDTDGDNVVDSYDNCDASICTQAGDWADIIAAQVYLLARNKEETTGHTNTNQYVLGPDALSADVVVSGDNDRYQRHVFSDFIRIMNPSIR